jgi:putative acyl-CoA dehydrogenase
MAIAVLSMRLARAFDAQTDEAETEPRRPMTPAVKYWLCKRASPLAAEAMEVLGGNGYVEESVMPRLYREMPLNGIWGGFGNVMCLDVLRAISNSSPLVTTTDTTSATVRTVPISPHEFSRPRSMLSRLSET